MGSGGNTYEGREQAWVKHQVLRRYLQLLAFKVGGFRSGTTLNYIDGFSGPWDAVKDDHGDSSPAIAMRELAATRLALAKAGKPMTPRAMFVERNATAFQRLTELCSSAPIEATPYRGEFESHIQEAVRFASGGTNPFAFVFIDPTGWTGFALPRVAPLLQVRRSEVLINFMWGHIGRFIDDAGSTAEASFDELFGEDTSKYRTRWEGLDGHEREYEVVRTYCERVRVVGGFAHCVSTVIVNPTIDRTHYHLVFATRSRKGLTTFRETERAVTPLQQEIRAKAKQRKEETATGQRSLFTPSAMDSDYFTSLVARYRTKARTAVEDALVMGREVPYETLVDVALDWPMTSEKELKAWIGELQREGRVQPLGLAANQRALKLDAGHRVRRVR